jgi:hypothetical protein
MAGVVIQPYTFPMSISRKRRGRRRQTPYSQRTPERIQVSLGAEIGEAEESNALPPPSEVEGRLVRSAPEAQRAYPARELTRVERSEG